LILAASDRNPGDQVAYAIAEKQLYSSHYFQTALDFSFCARGSDDPKQSRFYLIMAMGSEQVGLTGVKRPVEQSHFERGAVSPQKRQPNRSLGI
jgi:hypothetical protein